MVAAPSIKEAIVEAARAYWLAHQTCQAAGEVGTETSRQAAERAEQAQAVLFALVEELEDQEDAAFMARATYLGFARAEEEDGGWGEEARIAKERDNTG